MNYADYTIMKMRIDHGVAFVTIDNPSMNIMSFEMMKEIRRIGKDLEADDDVRVVVFDSADPEFFIAHADIGFIQELPQTVPPKATTLGKLHEAFEQIRRMPKVTIGKIEGIARGGGSEFLLSLDMRFGAIGKAVVGQPEVALGILPGGGGTQRLFHLVGRARAIEMVLGCGDLSAELAEKYGYLNRALPLEELGPFVEELAYRIASYPAKSIALAKASVDAARPSYDGGLIEEAHNFNQLLATEAAQERMVKFMEMGGQTRAFEAAPEFVENISKKM